MKNINKLAIVRGGGDIATGTIQKLYRTNFNVLVLETKEPTTVRTTVSVSTAVYTKYIEVEDIKARFCKNINDINVAFMNREVAVVCDECGYYIETLKPHIVIDAIIAKKNLSTRIDMADIVIALGPGFCAKKDCDVVIETNRGHDLARLIFEGYAQENTGIPGNIMGYSTDRVLYSKSSGYIKHVRKIGDIVNKGDIILYVGKEPVYAKIHGVVRGLIHEGIHVLDNMKLGDIDPRCDKNNIYKISDKARAIAGGVLEAIYILDGGYNESH